MAKIKGIELKNVLEFKGHEGEELLQGDVYFNGKKVGFYSQDAWGGMDIFNLFTSKAIAKITPITNNYRGGILFKKIDDLSGYTFQNLEQIGYEYFFIDLLQLIEHEKLYKKYSKKWGINKIFIVYDNPYELHISGGKLRDEDANKTYFEYNDLKDFIVD